jgi:O-antigen/teichoic acid export membrane protein
MTIFRSLIKSSAIYGGADFISKVISFFTFPFIAKTLSAKSFGYLELILTSTALLGVFGNFGLNNAVQRFYWDKGITLSDRKKIVSTGLLLQLSIFLSIVVFTFIFIFSFFPTLGETGHFTWEAIICALLLMAGNQWTQYLLDVIRLHFRPWRFFAVAMISRLLSAAFGLIAVVFMHKGIDGLMISQALIVLLILPLAVLMVKSEISIACISKFWAKNLLKFGYPFIFSGIAYWIIVASDRWMLARFSSLEEVGIYSVSTRFSSVLLFVSAAFGQAWSPVAFKIRTDYPTKYAKIYGDVLIILIIGMIFIAAIFSLFSGELITLIVGKKYLKSALPMSLLSFTMVIHATQQVTAIGISLEKRTKLFAYLTWGTTVCHLGLNFILIPHFDALGASWATFISYLLLSTSYFYFTQHLHPLRVNYKILSILIVTIFLLLLSSFIFFDSELIFINILFKAGILLVYLIIGLFIFPFKAFKNN